MKVKKNIYKCCKNCKYWTGKDELEIKRCIKSDEESIAEKVLNQGFVWNYPTCSYIPLSKFLEKEYNTLRKYGEIMYDCVTKYVGKFKGESK